jgi:hypothetical protein
LAPHQLCQREPLWAPQTGNTILEAGDIRKPCLPKIAESESVANRNRVGEYRGSYGRQLQFAL